MAKRFDIDRGEAVGADGQPATGDFLLMPFKHYVLPQNADREFEAIKTGTSIDQLQQNHTVQMGKLKDTNKTIQISDINRFDGFEHNSQTRLPPIPLIFNLQDPDEGISEFENEMAAHRRTVEQAYGLSSSPEPLNSIEPLRSREFSDAMEMLDRANEDSKSGSVETIFTTRDMPYVSVYPPANDEMVDVTEPGIGDEEILQAKALDFRKAKARRVYVTQEGGKCYTVGG